MARLSMLAEEPHEHFGPFEHQSNMRFSQPYGYQGAPPIGYSSHHHEGMGGTGPGNGHLPPPLQLFNQPPRHQGMDGYYQSAMSPGNPLQHPMSAQGQFDIENRGSAESNVPRSGKRITGHEIGAWMDEVNAAGEPAMNREEMTGSHSKVQGSQVWSDRPLDLKSQNHQYSNVPDEASHETRPSSNNSHRPSQQQQQQQHQQKVSPYASHLSPKEAGRVPHQAQAVENGQRPPHRGSSQSDMSQGQQRPDSSLSQQRGSNGSERANHSGSGPIANSNKPSNDTDVRGSQNNNSMASLGAERMTGKLVDNEVIPTAIVIKNIPFAVQKETLLAIIVSTGVSVCHSLSVILSRRLTHITGVPASSFTLRLQLSL